ncbi:MAG TPA: hypothetical protein VNO70_09360 [Blastocatellia bacterium]|nr:hypothetical protein [Blastocatellia bacterium]
MEIREAIAAAQHEIWSHWMRHLFTCGEFDEAGNFILPREVAQHWQRQMRTPYQKLSEREKDSDREQADKILALLNMDSIQQG